MAVTEKQPQDAIRTTEAIADTRRAGDYYRVVDDNRILWGGRITTMVREPAALAEAMRGDMVNISATGPSSYQSRVVWPDGICFTQDATHWA